MRLFAALGCSAQPCVAWLTLESMASPSQEWRGTEGAGCPKSCCTHCNKPPTFAVRLDDLQGSTARAALRLTCALAYGMAPHSHADAPVLEEWHIARNRPYACGVPGCIAQLVTKTHLRARLCAAHIKCLALLHGGLPQRWCGNCKRFHTLEAFSASVRCATASHWDCSSHPQD